MKSQLRTYDTRNRTSDAGESFQSGSCTKNAELRHVSTPPFVIAETTYSEGGCSKKILEPGIRLVLRLDEIGGNLERVASCTFLPYTNASLYIARDIRGVHRRRKQDWLTYIVDIHS